MRILHTADWHIGKSWKGVDRLPDLMGHIVPEIVEIALSEKVDLFLLAGDIFDGFNQQSLNLCRDLLSTPLKQLLQAGVSVVMIPGNHDNFSMFRLLDAALQINPFGDKAQLMIFTKPDVHVLDGLQIMAMPYLSLPRFKQVLASSKTELPLEKDLQNQALSNQYETVLQTLKSRKLKADQPAVLIGHFSVSGAKLRLEGDQAQKSYAGFETSYARDLSISREALLASDQVPQYNALGHIHLAQAVPETIAPTYYAGAPDYFERGEDKYLPQVLLIDVPAKGQVSVEPILLKQVTPFIAETIMSRVDLLALADNLGDSTCRRALGDLIIKVDDIADYAPLRDEAYRIFPRLKEANTVQAETPEAPPLKFETTEDYAQIANPVTMFEDYFSQNFDAEEIPSLQQALDTIMQELSHEN